MAVPGDLLRALRSVARRRTFAATVVLTLALAFSIPAVVLSTVDRHFWRPLDLTDSERLFTLQLQFDDGRFSPLSHPEYLQLRAAGAQAFSLATFGQFDFTLVGGGAPTRVNVALVSGNSRSSASPPTHFPVRPTSRISFTPARRPIRASRCSTCGGRWPTSTRPCR